MSSTLWDQLKRRKPLDLARAGDSDEHLERRIGTFA